MAYAARHPERIVHLTLVDSAAEVGDIIFLFKEVFPRRPAGRRAGLRGDARRSGGRRRRHPGVPDMLFYSPEKRDAFMAKATSYVYKRDINERLNSDWRAST